MRVKYTLDEVAGRVGSMRELQAIPLAAKLSYAISRAGLEFDAVLKPFSKTMEDLRLKYGGTSTSPISEDKQAEYAEEMEELLSTDVELELRPIELPPECSVSASLLRSLQDFVFVKGMADAPEASGEGNDSFLVHKKTMDALKARQAERLAGNGKPVEAAK